ncbi:hypothetical protein VTN31DRAFT_4230 [Thermomyces dupontii]|uniref:uncharacterized protein n=1 Tax=Talaromyces thermophilus TaxID=28565 RepID=UPI003743DB89
MHAQDVTHTSLYYDTQPFARTVMQATFETPAVLSRYLLHVRKSDADIFHEFTRWNRGEGLCHPEFDKDYP